ncbi:NAD(P)H-hydrate epimerase [archaeon]|nr:NAD(P)H-hydrate epimerase [archaeon]
MQYKTPQQMRDWEHGKDKLALMEKAGKTIAETLKEKKLVFVCGPGNNGGDGFTAARLLNTKVYAPFESKTTEAKINRAKLKPDQFVDSMHDFECIVDCLLGIGIKGELREPIKSLVEEINELHAHGVYVVSVDVPTGLGTTIEVQSDLTICLQFPKEGMQGKKFIVKTID